MVLKNYNRIDGLVNAAGGNVPEAVIKPGEDIFDIDMNAMHKAFELNLFGTMLPVSVFGEALQAIRQCKCCKYFFNGCTNNTYKNFGLFNGKGCH